MTIIEIMYNNKLFESTYQEKNMRFLGVTVQEVMAVVTEQEVMAVVTVQEAMAITDQKGTDNRHANSHANSHANKLRQHKHMLC